MGITPRITRRHETWTGSIDTRNYHRLMRAWTVLVIVDVVSVFLFFTWPHLTVSHTSLLPLLRLATCKKHLFPHRKTLILKKISATRFYNTMEKINNNCYRK